MTEYNLQLERLKEFVENAVGIKLISLEERRTLEGAYVAFKNNQETRAIGGAIGSLRGVLNESEWYRPNPDDRPQTISPRRVLTEAIELLEEIAKTQQKHI